MAAACGAGRLAHARERNSFYGSSSVSDGLLATLPGGLAYCSGDQGHGVPVSDARQYEPQTQRPARRFDDHPARPQVTALTRALGHMQGRTVFHPSKVMALKLGPETASQGGGRHHHWHIALGLDHRRLRHWMRSGGNRARALGDLVAREEGTRANRARPNVISRLRTALPLPRTAPPDDARRSDHSGLAGCPTHLGEARKASTLTTLLSRLVRCRPRLVRCRRGTAVTLRAEFALNVTDLALATMIASPGGSILA
jgi:hypothetical protein